MYLEFSRLTPNQVYHQMLQTLIPRPIAWVLSENADQSLNLAPFSYFNGVCSAPPLILLSVGKKPDGSWKDTRVNIEARSHFVVHIAHRELAQPLSESSASLPAGVSEVERLGLPLAPFEGFGLPRLADCRIAYACARFEIREIGAAPQALILGRIEHLFIDDGILVRDAKGRPRVDPARLDPLARLGADEYATLGEFLRLPRPV
jgi:flavin reductase (DIM6/NTAB) family NADH-FMN oxidoreductase RutF